MKFYPFNLGDYAEKTKHLTWDEDAVYRKLLDWYYSEEGPLPLDRRAMYKKLKADSEDRRAACDAVLGEFFISTEAGWRHEKCDEKIEKFYAKSKSASERGKAGAQKKQAKAQLNAKKDKLITGETKLQLENDGFDDVFTEKTVPKEGDEQPEQAIASKKQAELKLKEEKDKLQLAKIKLPNTQYPILNPLPPNPNPSGVVVVKDDFDRFEAQLRSLPGIEKHPVMVAPSIAPIWRLVQAGANIQTQIIPTIKTVLEKSKPGTIKSWGYFSEAITREISLAANTPPINAITPPEQSGMTWEQRMNFARKNLAWDSPKWGPCPNQPECFVPSGLVKPDDGKGWQEWAVVCKQRRQADDQRKHGVETT